MVAVAAVAVAVVVAVEFVVVSVLVAVHKGALWSSINFSERLWTLEPRF